MARFLKSVVPLTQHKKQEFRLVVARVLTHLFNLCPDNFVAKIQERTATDQANTVTAIAKTSKDASDRLSAQLSLKPARTKRPDDDSGTVAATIIQSIERGRRSRKLSKEMKSGIIPFDQRMMNAEDNQLREKLDAYRQRKERRRAGGASSSTSTAVKQIPELQCKPPVPRQGGGRKSMSGRRSVNNPTQATLQASHVADRRTASRDTGHAEDFELDRSIFMTMPTQSRPAVAAPQPMICSTPVRRLREEAEKLRTLITVPGDVAPHVVVPAAARPAAASPSDLKRLCQSLDSGSEQLPWCVKIYSFTLSLS